MAKDPPQTIGDLRRKAIVTDAEVMAAIDAYLADRKSPPYQFKSGHVLDVGAAIDAHRPSQGALSTPGISDTFRRTMIRTAVILAVPSAG